MVCLQKQKGIRALKIQSPNRTIHIIACHRSLSTASRIQGASGTNCNISSPSVAWTLWKFLQTRGSPTVTSSPTPSYPKCPWNAYPGVQGIPTKSMREEVKVWCRAGKPSKIAPSEELLHWIQAYDSTKYSHQEVITQVLFIQPLSLCEFTVFATNTYAIISPYK